MASANIFQQYLQPVKSIADYSADLDRESVSRMALMAQKQALADDKAAREASIASGGDTNKLLQLLQSGGNYKAAQAVQKSMLDSQKVQADIGLTKAQTAKSATDAEKVTQDIAVSKEDQRYKAAQYHAQGLAYVKTPGDIVTYIDQGIARGVIPAEQRQMMLEAANRMASVEDFVKAATQASVPILEQYKTAADNARNAADNANRVLTTRMNNDTSVKTTGMNNATSIKTTGMNNATTQRGQNMSDARSREANQTARDAVGKVDWKQDTNGNWVGLPKEVNLSQPVVPVTTTVAGKRETQAKQALDIISEAKGLIDKATGSYAGAAFDQGARVFGKSTQGADAAARLKALEGALMMAQPRMEGPQSDKDVMLYRQMAGQIGDPTAPADIKKAAIDTVEKLHQKYAAGTPVMQGANAGQLAGADAQALQWANSNPKDPRAAQIKQRLGVK